MIDQTVLKSFKGKNALVTGGTGLIGRQVVDILIEAGATVNIASLDKHQVNPKANHLIADLCYFDACKKVTTGMDFVFHLAGVKGSASVTAQKPASFFVPLLMMNTNILEACRVNKVHKVVYTSSVGAYSEAEVFEEVNDDDLPPMDTYPGWAKRMAEKQIKAYQVQYGLDNFAIVRPTNVYGPGDNFDPENAMVIPSLMYKIKQHKMDTSKPVVIWGDGSAIRDFAYSKDVAKGIILALYYGTSGFVNLGGGREYTIKYLVKALQCIIGFDYEYDTSKPSGFPRRVMDIWKARKLFNYDPSTDLLTGLGKTWEWFLNNPEEYKQKQNYFTEEE